MQFDVYKNQNAASSKRFPFLLDVQAELLDDLQTRVVVPLADKRWFAGKILSQLTPVFTVQGTEVVALTPQIAGIAKRELGAHAGNLSAHRHDILSALDLLLTGV